MLLSTTLYVTLAQGEEPHIFLGTYYIYIHTCKVSQCIYSLACSSLHSPINLHFSIADKVVVVVLADLLPPLFIAVMDISYAVSSCKPIRVYGDLVVVVVPGEADVHPAVML